MDGEDATFDAVDEFGVPNAEAEAGTEAAWLAANPGRPVIDPYDESVPIGARLGTQKLTDPARGYPPPPERPAAPPKRRRWHIPRLLGKRARRAPATIKPPPLYAVGQTPATDIGKSSADLREIISSLAEVFGISAISYGSWLAWHPAGFIVGGMGTVLLGVAYGRNA